MPILKIYIDDDMERWMRAQAEQLGRSIEHMAEAAVENAALEAGFRKPQEHWTTELQRATNSD